MVDERTEKALKDAGKQIEDILVRDGYITVTKIREIIGLYPYKTMNSDDRAMLLMYQKEV